MKEETIETLETIKVLLQVLDVAARHEKDGALTAANEKLLECLKKL